MRSVAAWRPAESLKEPEQWRQAVDTLVDLALRYHKTFVPWVAKQER